MNIVLVDVAADKNFATLGYHPHPGLAYMAAALERQGHKVNIVDPVISSNSTKHMVAKIAEHNPRIVGITSTTAARFEAITVIEALKEQRDIFIIAGGCHFQPTARDAMSRIPDIDCIIKGEGEDTIVEIAHAVEAGTSLSEIKGIFYRQDGDIVETQDRPINDDLDSLPIPAYHLFDLKRYKVHLLGSKGIPALGVMSSRGCPCKCIFCSITALRKHKFRKRSPGLFVDEVERYQKDYGYKAFQFFDDTITMDRNHITNICQQILKRNMNIQWSALARVNTVDKDILSLMKSAGCRYLMYGVESGSDITLHSLKKGITVEQAIKAIDLTVDMGIPLDALFMLSLPGETMKEASKTIDLIKKFSSYPNTRAPYGFTCIYPGTEVEEMAHKEGILPGDFSWNKKYLKPVYRVLGTDPYSPCWETPNLPLMDLKAAIFKSRSFSYKIKQIFHKLKLLSLQDLSSAVKFGIRTLTVKKELV